jgi:hypothetical protein
MGSELLEESGTAFEKVNTYTYFMFPLNMALLAGWFKILGFGLIQLRAFSMLWTFLFFVAFFQFLKVLFQDGRLAFLGTALIALDYNIMVAATFGRYDTMVLALGFGSYALYLTLREKHLTWALLTSASCIVAAGMTHPNGMIFQIGLCYLILRHDRGRLRWRHLPLVAIPYLVGAIGWGLYIAQSPHAFLAQMRANSGGRIGILAPLQSLHNEVVGRLMPAFGFPAKSHAGHVGPVWLKALSLVAYLTAILGCLVTRGLRTHLGCRVLLALTGIHAFYLTFVDGMKFTYYLIHILPLWVGLLVCFTAWCWKRQVVLKVLVTCGLTLLVAVQVGGILQRVRLNTYGNTFLPAATYLKQHVGDNDLVNGSCELVFGYGYKPNIVDDIRLGYGSGKNPKFIVLDEVYETNIGLWKNSEPDLYRFIENRIEREYQLVYDRAFYKIYRRVPLAGESADSGR